ncbi:hypothetical protein [Sinorhizobium sp. BJ1]|uniref:hypothetical protein n=1 Tax=Sinorhizobium sp. BJ1 TaxID=2035455 RepID=UPI000BE88227|nr:hypothetical protein [Sinorhizobium sp. BJ1]PDT79971.1 hypothetical protein CO676_30460 [Sinorhizobium sp. BJ1]
MARHASLAEQLSAFRRYVTTPDHDPEPISTNWTVTPANDNNPEEVAELRHERKRIVTPSVAEIMRHVKEGDVERNDAGQIVRIGKLRFSDGKQTEKAYRLTIDGKIEQYDARMPTGAMLGTRDKVDTALGGAENPQEVTESNIYFAEMLDTRQHKYVTGKKFRGERVKTTREETKRELAEAYSNTDMTKVTFIHYPDGLPCGSAKVADSFLGMQKTTCSGGGSTMWQDIVSEREERKEWLDAVGNMANDHLEILTMSAKASSLKQIGIARGYKGQYAIEAGRRLLVAANDNFQQAMELANYAKDPKTT